MYLISKVNDGAVGCLSRFLGPLLKFFLDTAGDPSGIHDTAHHCDDPCRDINLNKRMAHS